MRKLFYENLLINSNYKNGRCIKWSDSVGKTIKFIYDDIEGYIVITNYDSKTSYVTYNYNNQSYTQTTTSLKKCQLGKMLFNCFKYNVGDVLHSDDGKCIQILSHNFETYKNKQRIKNYIYKCLNCGFEGKKTESELEKTWCPCCCKSPVLVVEGINDIPTTDPWMIPYFQGGYIEAKQYTHSSAKKIYPFCPLCKKIKKKAIAISQIYTTKSIGCNCGDGISYPNKFMYNILVQLNVEFETEYSPNWIKPKRYDFYIPSMNIIIEIDGGLGHGKGIFQKSKLTNEELNEKQKESLKIDDIKNDIASLHGIILIRIDASKSQIDYLKQSILNSDLCKYLNFENIDWFACDKYATKNIIKELCDFYKNNLFMSYQDTSKKFHISKCTIGRYLKKGFQCDWLTQEEYNTIINNNNNQKITYVYDLKFKLLNKFNSATELIKLSKDLYGIQFTSSGITYATKEKSKYHNKFYISYSSINSKEEFIKKI